MMKIVRKFHEWNLDRKQADVVNELEKFGFSDEILEKQVAINKKRHELDIADKDKIIYDKFVQ